MVPGKANGDLIADGRRSRWPRPGRRTAIAIAVLFGLALVGAAGVSYAGYDYSQDYEGRILPRTRIAGVDVSGMTPEQALEEVHAAIRPQLTRRIEVTWGERSWTVTPKKLGARNDAAAAVEAALSASRQTTFFQKAKMRVLGDELSFERDIAITYPRQGARGFIEGLASNIDQEARDASIDYSTGWVEIAPERTGQRVLVDRSRAALLRALRTGDSKVQLAVDELEPEVTTDSFDQILLLRIGENKLYLYDDGAITHEWPVATGQPEYPTPTGQYYITEKRYMPTWVNPDPEGWGASMPAEIPPGPGNPLGTRALNWSADAIRFHGTSADYSIGYNASHGCVRMHMSDVEQLYDLVEVGTPIVSINVGSMKPLYESGPDPILVEGDAE
ncbi:MAG: L,D-transpeptidase family protein [Actinomycetota bacterium]